MATPTSITFTYISTLPSTTSTVTVAIPASSTYDATVRNAVLAGGIWVTNSSGVLQWIALSQIVGATAQ